VADANPTPFDNPELFSSIILAGVVSPGKVTLSGHDRTVKWDVKEAKELDGASMDIKSVPAVEFTATFDLVDDPELDEFEQWDEFVEIIESTVGGKKVQAVDIYHPYLAAQRPPITSVVKATVGGIVDDEKGGRRIAVKFQEYRPPKPKKGSPTGSKTSKPDPNADVKTELSLATAAYATTPWG